MNNVIIAEVGGDSVRLVHAHPSRKGQCRVSKIVVFKYDQTNETSVQTLTESLSKLKFGGIPVIGCLPRQAVNVRLLEIPSTDPDEIADMVELQVGRLTPYPRDEIVVDFRIMGPGRQGYTHIMLILVQRVLMAQRFRILENAGLAVESMSVSSEGLLNWFNSVKGAAKGEKDATLLVDVDAACTDVAAVSGGRLLFTRSIMIGAVNLTDAPDQWREKFLQEIELSLDICRSEAGSQPASKILLCGAGGAVEGLAAAIHDRTKLPLQVADGMEKIQKDSGVPDLKSPELKKLSFQPLLGLAIAPEMIHFNLVPEAVHARREIEAKARGLTGFGTLVLTAVFMLSILGITIVQRSAEYLANLQRVDSEISGRARQVEQMKQTTVMVMKRLNLQCSPLAILVELHRILPPAVHLESIVVETEQSITLKGKAKSFPEVDNFRGRLEASSIIYPYVISRRQTRNKEGLVEFELVCRMEKE